MRNPIRRFNIWRATRRWERTELGKAVKEGRASIFPEKAPPGLVLRTHGPEVCSPEYPCCIHRPSDHHMKDWPWSVRLDRFDLLTERHCPDHGIGHPDPDSLSFIERQYGKDTADVSGIHGCDGCCRPPS